MVAFANTATTTLGKVTPMMDDALLAVMRTYKPQPQMKRGKTSSVDGKVAATVGNYEAPEPSTLDTVLARGESALGTGGMAVMFAPMGIGLAGGALRKVGGWTGIKSVEGGGNRLKNIGAWFAKPVNETFLRRPIEETAGAIGNVVAGPVGAVSKSTGLSGWMQRSHAKNADKQLAKARDLLGNLDMTKVPQELHGHVHEIHSMAKTSSMVHVDASRLERSMQSFGEAAKAYAEKPAARDMPVPKAITKAVGKLENAVGHHAGSGNWKDIKGFTKNASQAMGKMEVGHVLSSGAWTIGSALSIASDARSFKHNVATLKQMYADLTGQKISTQGVLFGKVPRMVADARSHLIKNTAFKNVTDAIGLVANFVMLVNPRFGGSGTGMAAFGAPAFLQMGYEAVTDPSVLPVYEQLRGSFDPKAQMPDAYYAAFIGAMSKELKARGGAESPFAQEVAKQYAAARATPEQVLRDIESGAMMKRVEAVIAENKKLQAAQPQAAAHTPTKAARAVVGHHTKKLVKAEAAQQAAGHTVT